MFVNLKNKINKPIFWHGKMIQDYSFKPFKPVAAAFYNLRFISEEVSFPLGFFIKFTFFKLIFVYRDHYFSCKSAM